MLSPADIERLLALLAAKLVAAEVDATITVAGGATMGLVYRAREATVDIDALLRPVEAIRAAAAEIAVDEDLPGGVAQQQLRDVLASAW